MVDKPTLVDKHTTIVIATLHSLGNLGKQQRMTLLNIRKEPYNKPISRCMLSWYCDTSDGRGLAPAPNQQRAITATECRAAIKERILLDDGRQQGRATL